MKKLLILLSIFLFAEQTQAQKNYYLTPVTIDNEVSVSLPKEFVKNNGQGGQQSFVGNGLYGTMFVIKSTNPTNVKAVKNADGLDDVFKEYIKKVQSSVKGGSILNDHDTVMGKVKVCDFILQVDTGSGLQMRHFRLLYTKSTTYTFEYMYDDFRKDVALGEMNAFFHSIKTAPDLDQADQYVITPQNSTSVILKIVLFGLIPLGIIIGLVIFFRRRTVSLT